ncbi:MAG: TadE/TadG family type IV pilus assembly protein [Actinomycetota bacterium]
MHPLRRSGDDGAAAVETALVLPLILLITFGLINFGLALNANLSITNAANEGARASMLGETSTAAIRARVLSTGDPLSATFLSAPNVAVTNAGCASSGETRVNVSYTFDLLVPVPGLSSFDIAAVGVEKCFD